MAEKILVVDDDLDTVQYLQVVLSRLGYQVLIARDGLEALKVANQEKPDLIVLDVMMPIMDGLEVARSLHRQASTALIPILMFTAKTQPEDKVAGYEAGVDLYLTKPVNTLDLQASIKTILLQRQAHKVALAERGYVVGVVSAKGGVGVSTLVLNLAVSYARQQKIQVIAAELRPAQGIWAEELNMKGSSGLVNLLRMNSSEITQSQVASQLTDTGLGVKLLLAGDSTSADVALSNQLNQYDIAIHELSLLAPIVFLDLGTPFLPAFPIIEEQCDEFVLVTEPQALCVRLTARFLEELRPKGFGSSKALSLVSVNRTRADSIMSISQIENALHIPVALGFPPALELAARAEQVGKPLVVLQPEALVSTQFNQLAGIIAKHIAK